MIIIELFLLFSGLTISFIFIHLRLFVNLIYFFADFIVFLLLFIWIRKSFEIRAEYKQLPVIFCAGLRESFLDYTEEAQRFIDKLAWTIFSPGFWVLILSIVFLISFFSNLSGNSGGDLGDFFGSGPAGYISITLFALIMDILLHHWNEALIWRRKEK